MHCSPRGFSAVCNKILYIYVIEFIYSKILALGFNEKFIRTWEYYFDYCAAGFKSYTLGNYQVVFSRPGNASAFSNPYKSFPPAC
ncbi:hypothetical protein Patl1_25671 [Pistacia atlantica]|uniref:Uncharacterized protein n=1 Tax=Pistacia atlantica TaxID=434234 RepID=A0ACC1B1Y7_9ROSI|nr:hypothetical protein Patl1_25671 [Pistacia atlantica]